MRRPPTRGSAAARMKKVGKGRMSRATPVKRFGGVDPREMDLRNVDARLMDARTVDSRHGVIGADAFLSLTGQSSGLTRSDLLSDTFDFELEELLDDGAEEFGLFRRDIEKDLEGVRRKLERLNRKGLRNKRDQKRYAKLKSKHDHLLEVMQESRGRAVPRYTDPQEHAMFSPAMDLFEDDEDTLDAFDMELIDISDEVDPAEERLENAIDTIQSNLSADPETRAMQQEQLRILDLELRTVRAGV